MGMSEAEPPPKEPPSQPKPDRSPPRWLLQVLAKCWWLIGFEALGLLGVVLLIPMAQGFDHFWQHVQEQVAALLELPPALIFLLGANFPLLAWVSWQGSRTLKAKEEEDTTQRLITRVKQVLEEENPLAPVTLL